jgi:erythrocyte band 7 integral membrane protein
VIFRLGRNILGGAKGPGLFFVLPCVDSINKIDLRTITFDVPPQEILTKDSVTVSVDAVCYIRIFDPVQSVNKVANAQVGFWIRFRPFCLVKRAEIFFFYFS